MFARLCRRRLDMQVEYAAYVVRKTYELPLATAQDEPSYRYDIGTVRGPRVPFEREQYLQFFQEAVPLFEPESREYHRYLFLGRQPSQLIVKLDPPCGVYHLRIRLLSQQVQPHAFVSVQEPPIYIHGIAEL